MPGPPEDCYCRFGNATCQECETRGYPYSWGLCPGCELHNGRDLGAYKRLKDVECAAEFWRAATVSERARAAQAITRETDDFLPVARGFLASSREQITWHRFATRPHALEES